MPALALCGHGNMMNGIPHFDQIETKVDGHRLTLSVSGADRLSALLDLIEGAQTTLRVFFYIFGDDETAAKVRSAMIAARARCQSVAAG